VVHDDGYMSMYASEWGLIVALPSTVGPANLVCPGEKCVPLSESLRGQHCHVGRKARERHEVSECKARVSAKSGTVCVYWVDTSKWVDTIQRRVRKLAT
jgi:hypothetical protein